MEPNIKLLLKYENEWKTLDVDYFPPRVERLYTTYCDCRVHLHIIHPTNKKCLYHKHRWPAVIKQLKGSYEMGITYSAEEVSTDEAHNLPTLAKFKINEGSYYEMKQTDCLHYVKPDNYEPSYSIMLTKDLYPEASFRKETVDRKLEELSDERKKEILKIFKTLL